jgi:hypothetical protein
MNLKSFLFGLFISVGCIQNELSADDSNNIASNISEIKEVLEEKVENSHFRFQYKTLAKKHYISPEKRLNNVREMFSCGQRLGIINDSFFAGYKEPIIDRGVEFARFQQFFGKTLVTVGVIAGLDAFGGIAEVAKKLWSANCVSMEHAWGLTKIAENLGFNLQNKQVPIEIISSLISIALGGAWKNRLDERKSEIKEHEKLALESYEKYIRDKLLLIQQKKMEGAEESRLLEDYDLPVEILRAL